MRPNPIRAIWAAGGCALNAWLHIPSTWSAEVMAAQGWDGVCVDLQHGLADYAMALGMFQAVGERAVPLARAPWNEPGIIGRLLDAGALGIICPMVNTADDAERFVSAMRYAPRGTRSLGPTRAAVAHGADYARHADREVIALPMIETAEALENLDSILAVDGLDGVYVGPGDLTLSLRGTGTLDNADDAFLRIAAHIAERARAHGKIAGMHTNSAAYARRMRALGYQFLTVMTDTRMLTLMAQQTLAAMAAPDAAASGAHADASAAHVDAAASTTAAGSGVLY